MSSDEYAPGSQSVVNLVALQNLRLIRRRINDKKWLDAGARRLRKDEETRVKRRRGPRSTGGVSFAYQEKLMSAVFLVIAEYAQKGKIAQGWDPDSGLPFPEHPNTRKAFAIAAGIDDGRLRVLDGGTVQFTLDEAVQIARVGNMDLATFLTPCLEDLDKETYFPLRPIKGKSRNPLMSEWLLWLHGFRPLPGQDESEFIKQTGSPGPKMFALDDPRTYRGHDERDKESERVSESAFYMLDIASDFENSNPFNALLNPFQKAPQGIKSRASAHRLLIRYTLLLATQLKVIMSTKRASNIKKNAKRFVTLIDFIRNCISGIVRLTLRLEK